MSKSIVNVNGSLKPSEEAAVSVFDRGFLYGDSIYEVTMTQNKKPIFLKEHLDRLWVSAERLFMPMPWSREELIREVQKGIDKLDLPRVYIRIIITRGEGEIGLDPGLADNNNLFIITKELPEYPADWYTKGVHMIVADVVRNPKRAIDPDVKSGNYLNNVMAMAQAKKAGAFDAIMLNQQGFVTEGTTNNLWMVKNGTLMTPPLQAGLLSGITRHTILKLCEKHGIPAKEANFTPIDMIAAEECFLSSSTKEVVPITKIDVHTIGDGRPGPMTAKIHQIYRDFVAESLALN